MANINEVYAGKYLKAELDVIEGEDKTYLIKDVDTEEFENDGKKKVNIVLTFKGEKKPMVCNQTNARVLAECFGSSETDDWAGKKVVLCSTEVQFGKDMVFSLRVVKKKTLAANLAAVAPKAAKVTVPADADEDIPIPF